MARIFRHYVRKLVGHCGLLTPISRARQDLCDVNSPLDSAAATGVSGGFIVIVTDDERSRGPRDGGDQQLGGHPRALPQYQLPLVFASPFIKALFIMSHHQRRRNSTGHIRGNDWR